MAHTLDAGWIFMFPGQGSQQECMGRCLLERHEVARAVWRRASEIQGEDLVEICMHRPFREMQRTDRAQMLIGAFSLSLVELLEQENVQPALVLGHSAGELSALRAAGVLDLDGALHLMAARGRLMLECAARHPGKMVAVMNLGREALEERLEPLRRRGAIGLANYNAPTQLIVSGDRELVVELEGELAGLPDVRVEDLRQQGAWHSAHMLEAQARFAEVVARTPFAPPRVPMLFGHAARFAHEPQELKREIVAAITGTVQWYPMLQQLARLGAARFAEVGPNKILRGLLRRGFQALGVRQYEIQNLDTAERLEQFVERTRAPFAALAG